MRAGDFSGPFICLPTEIPLSGENLAAISDFFLNSENLRIFAVLFK
jgi:hypothetical protein